MRHTIIRVLYACIMLFILGCCIYGLAKGLSEPLREAEAKKQESIAFIAQHRCAIVSKEVKVKPSVQETTYYTCDGNIKYSVME